jgi:hypothetical protein
MAQTVISRKSDGLLQADAIMKSNKLVSVNDTRADADAICGKIEFDHLEGDATIYRQVAVGCLWIYLTDCNGVIKSGMQFNCVPGNTLRVEGCHSFGCTC